MCSVETKWHRAVYKHILGYVYGTAIDIDTDIPVERIEEFLARLLRDHNDWNLALRAQYITHYWDLISHLLTSELPQLIRVLAHTTRHVEEEGIQRITGSIDWVRTIQHRLKTSTAEYVLISLERSYDTPENAVLVWWLRNMESVCLDLYAALHQGSTLFQTNKDTLITRIDSALKSSREFLRNVRLRSIKTLEHLDARSLNHAYVSRNPVYHTVAALSHSLNDILTHDQTESTRQLFRDALLIPESKDTLFELYALMSTIKAIQALPIWSPRATLEVRRLIRAGRDEVYSIIDESTGHRLDVFYNQAIIGQSHEGVYSHVFHKLGISASERRPDIVLRHSDPEDKRTYLLLDAKRTQNARYISDSVYKLLAYIKDYEDVLSPESVQAVLIVEAGLNRTNDPIEGIEGATVDDIESGYLIEILTEWIQSLIGA